jgi:hypothetical protein
MKACFQKVFIIIRPGMQVIVAEQLNKWIQPARYELIVQEQSRPKPWGTAHALHFLCGKWDGPFLVRLSLLAGWLEPASWRWDPRSSWRPDEFQARGHGVAFLGVTDCPTCCSLCEA